MRKILTAALAVLAIGGAAVATSADARDWRDHDGWRGHDRDHDGWRRDGGRYYGPPAYYRGGDFWGFYDGCRTHWRWDAWRGQYVRVASCY